MDGKFYAPEDLPNGMIALDTTQGQTMLNRTSIVNDLMIDRFANQVSRTFCGPASLALLINALNLAYRIKYKEAQGDKEAESEFFKQAEDGHFRVNENDIVNVEEVKEFLKKNSINVSSDGLTMKNLEHIVNILGLGVNIHFACGNSVCDVEKMKGVNAVNPEHIFHTKEEFQKFAADYIKRPVTGIIVNYFMESLGYKGLRGHFSPLAAYDSESDMFLVMDVWPETPPAWVKTEQLFNAMSTVDNDAKSPRGLLHIHELVW